MNSNPQTQKHEIQILKSHSSAEASGESSAAGMEGMLTRCSTLILPPSALNPQTFTLNSNPQPSNRLALNPDPYTPIHELLRSQAEREIWTGHGPGYGMG